MASFRKRNSRQWQAQVRKKGYPTQTKSFITRAAAPQWVRYIEYEMDQGLLVSRNEAETTTVGELLDQYSIAYTGRESMWKWRKVILGTLRSSTRNRHELALENLALRQQLATLKYRCPRPRLTDSERQRRSELRKSLPPIVLLGKARTQNVSSVSFGGNSWTI